MGEATRPALWRRALFGLLVLELVSVVVFLGVLLVGERSRSTLIALYLPRHPLLLAAVVGAALAPLTRRRVRLLVALHAVLALVVLFPVMGLSVSLPRHAAHPIRLATYNVFFGKLGRPALIEELAALDVDILCVEASFGSLGEKLKARLPDRNVRQEGELVVASRFPIRGVEAPPPLPDGTPAMFLKVVVETPEGDLRVVVLHAYSPRHALFGDHAAGDDIAQRDAQVGAAVAAARSDVPPFVLAGDTNLPVLSAVARRHFAGLHDAFADAGLGFGYSFPSKRPWMRIDRVLGSDGVRFTDARVGPHGTSDHRPLVVELELEGDAAR